jgi:hypothetical protein
MISISVSPAADHQRMKLPVVICHTPKTDFMNNTGKLVTAVAAGAVMGTLVGLLFAPEKGTETRKKIKEQGSRFAQNLKQKFEKAKERNNYVNEVAGDIE